MDAAQQAIVEQPVFTIFAAFRNAGLYAAWCLKSILDQDFSSWQVVIVDDFSTDDSWAELYKVMPHDDPRIWAFRTPERRRKLANFLAYWPIVRGDIIVELDGDDWFSRPDALSRIKAVYDADARVEATAGSHHGWPQGHTMRPITQPVRGCRLGGDFAWSVPAPRTWKRTLTVRSFAECPEIYIDPISAKPWDTNADRALFGPALMFSEHIAGIDDILVEISLSGEAHDAKEDRAKHNSEAVRLDELMYGLEWRLNEHLLRPFKATGA